MGGDTYVILSRGEEKSRRSREPTVLCSIIAITRIGWSLGRIECDICGDSRESVSEIVGMISVDIPTES